MPSLALDDRLIWFAHCPKAGGTSVETALVAQWGDRVGHLHWGWDRWWARGGWRVADPPNSPQHLIWEDALARLPRPPDDVFALVRDPVERMLSEYRWQRSHRRGTQLGRWLACLPFSLWLRVMLATARRAPFAFDNHFRPQADFVPETAAVFRLEEGLDPVFVWLAGTTGSIADAPPPHALRTGGRARVVAASDQARILAAFEADYARFGYPRPTVHPTPPDHLDRLAEAVAPLIAWLYRRGRL